MNYFLTQPLPRMFETDDAGFLLPPASSPEGIDPGNIMTLKDIIQHCEMIFDEDFVSLYFRGSQLFDRQNSDFDTVVVVRNPPTISPARLSTRLTNALSGKYPSIKYYDTDIMTLDELAGDRYRQFIIKVLSVRVFGPAVEMDYPGFQPNREIAFLHKKLPGKIAAVRAAYPTQKGIGLVLCRNHCIKYLLRTGYELVIEKEGGYTRDLTFCYKAFCRHFPQYGHLSGQLLSWYDVREVPAEEFWSVVDQLVPLLEREIKKIF
ncbi:hypothetical protein [Puia sp.]|jgi:hypothetical protein|uniref:hypothetical protein n=1 Tax=Puia sp. TaxID=2045100 RepID=UPI002F3EE1F7